MMLINITFQIINDASTIIQFSAYSIVKVREHYLGELRLLKLIK